MLQRTQEFLAANAGAFTPLVAMAGFSGAGGPDNDQQVGRLPMLQKDDVAILTGLDALVMINEKKEKITMIRFNFMVLGNTAAECFPAVCYSGRLTSHMPSAVKAKLVGKFADVNAIAEAGDTVIKVSELIGTPNKKDPDRTDWLMKYDVQSMDTVKIIYPYLG